MNPKDLFIVFYFFWNRDGIMKSQIEIVKAGEVAKSEEPYSLFIYNYCKRLCVIVTKKQEKPVGCPFLDEHVPMPWKDHAE
jgi:hypothetical protein